MHSHITHTGRHLQERCSDIWIYAEGDNGDDGDGRKHMHSHTCTLTFSLWHTREENSNACVRKINGALRPHGVKRVS